MASRYSRRKEYLAARSGAKGFITKDISEPYLLKAIKVISSGEICIVENRDSDHFKKNLPATANNTQRL